MRDFLNVKPKIGWMAVGCRGYWNQFPGMREHLICQHEKLAEKFADECDLIAVGMVDTPEMSKQAGLRFMAEDVDAVFCQAMTYATSDNLVPAIANIGVPVVLLNIQEEKSLHLKSVQSLEDWLGHGCTCAGIAELAAMLRRYEKRFDIITGYLNNDAVVENSLMKWVRAAAVRRKMKTANIGLLGRQYLGMMDLYLDENAVMKQFGMMTKYLMWEEVLALSHSVTLDEKEDYILAVKQVFTIPKDIAENEIETIAVMYGAYRKLIEKHNLIALPNHFERETVGQEIELMAALNPAHTMLQKEGVACPVEGDIKSALAMLILKTVAGSANLAELYSMDFSDDICLIGHSGASDPHIATEKPVLKMASMFHGKAGKGFTTQAVPQPGPLTMLALTMREDGQFVMVAAQGMIEQGEILNLGDTNCRVRFEMPMREFVNKWSACGPSHHGVIGLGHHIKTLEAVAKVLGVEIEIVANE